MLSDSDSNDVDEFNKKKKKQEGNMIKNMDVQEIASESSEPFDLPRNIVVKTVTEDTLSQLPKVDLGEDFDWQEIVNKSSTSNNISTEITINKLQSTEITTNKEKITDVMWSKGQVPGLQV